MQKKFDSYLTKDKECGYITYQIYSDGSKKERAPYKSYMTNMLFEELILEMKNRFPNAYYQYFDGNGSELKEKGRKNEKTGEVSMMPPKMASYGSSSLMTYLKFREIDGFIFEYKMDTTFSKRYPACLDGFLETENSYIFIESKCREIYGEGNYPFKRSNSYFKLYNEYISKIFKTDILKKDKEIFVKLENSDGLKIEYFDISQMVCHILGICKFLENKTKTKKIKFLYFLFSPREHGIDDKEILQRYDSTVKEIKSIDFKELFSIIGDFLRKEKKINIDTGWDFSFELCHQNNILGEIKWKK